MLDWSPWHLLLGSLTAAEGDAASASEGIAGPFSTVLRAVESEGLAEGCCLTVDVDVAGGAD